ncbi:MAG: hypothetical protein FJ090_03910 [Deltaproteobacteria bacterium]|nr:hypothetical protein [Deltaproteobacteria bacterium]
MRLPLALPALAPGLLAAWLVACVPPADDAAAGPSTPEDTRWTETFPWTLSTPLPCPVEPQEGDAVVELLDALGLEADIGISQRTYERYGGAIASDPARLSHFHRLQEDLTEVPCFAANRAARADLALASDHPLASLVADAASELDLALTVGGEVLPVATEDPLGQALSDLGATDVPDLDAVPSDVQRAVASLLGVIPEIAEGREAAFAALSATRVRNVVNRAPYVLLLGGTGLDPDDPDSTGLFTARSDGWVTLYEGAVRLAQVLDETDWGALASDAPFSVTVETPLGLVLLRGGGDDTYDPAAEPLLDEPILLALDTGGNDLWRIAAGTSADADQPVGVAIDLGGDDTYAYVEVPDADDLPGLLVSDADGRYGGDASYGPLSLSTVPRQGAGVAGHGFLLDLGGGDDTYRSPRMSQGFGAWGVGVLFDDGGDDAYTAEAGAQGVGIGGIGLHVDREGDDTYRAFTEAQGFGFVLGNGALLDSAGNDAYELVVDEVLLYYSPQLPGTANASLGQGVAFGWRRDSTGTHLAGGLGMLRDASGDDRYEGATFVQGVGYWMGMGILADGAGNDAYDGLFYAQAAAAHFALAAFLDAAGDDRFGTNLEARHSVLGLGHDYSVVVLVESGGNDTYVGVDRSIGAAKCHGLGLFVEGGGDDAYTSSHHRSIGWATDYDGSEGDCGSSNTIDSYGLFVDLDGADTYTKPDDSACGDDRTCINDDVTDPDASEHGGALDGTGRSCFAL